MEKIITDNSVKNLAAGGAVAGFLFQFACNVISFKQNIERRYKKKWTKKIGPSGAMRLVKIRNFKFCDPQAFYLAEQSLSRAIRLCKYRRECENFENICEEWQKMFNDCLESYFSNMQTLCIVVLKKNKFVGENMKRWIPEIWEGVFQNIS